MVTLHFTYHLALNTAGTLEPASQHETLKQPYHVVLRRRAGFYDQKHARY